jgi:hypothetical protein
MRRLNLDLDGLAVDSFATGFNANLLDTLNAADDTVAPEAQPIDSSDRSNYTCPSGGSVCCA